MGTTDESNFNTNASGNLSGGYRLPLGRPSGRYCFFKTRRYGKLHFEKCVSEAYASDLITIEALRKEFEIGYSLEHPNIVKYLAKENLSIFEEYVDGKTLREMIESNDGRLKDHVFLSTLCRQLLQALSYIHSQGVVHLDIKPENVMICNIGNNVKLLDFGAAKNGVFDSTEGYTATVKAPEQGTGKSTNVYTDIYLAGKLMQLLSSKAGLSDLWMPFLIRAMASDPAKRFKNAGEALRGIPVIKPETKPVTPLPAYASRAERSHKGDGSSKGSWWKIALLLGVLGIVFLTYILFNGDNQESVETVSSSSSEFEQARKLIQGIGGVQDEAEGMRLMHIAANKGDAYAQCYLGVMYRDGCATLQRDPAKSLMWIKKAAEQGNEIALEELGYKYYEGYGVKQDYKEAMKWLKLAAEKGKATAYSSIGIMYRNGEGVKQDYMKAEENFLKGAAAGVSYSAYLLGRLYSHYMSPPQKEKAVEWYKKASDMGSHRATEILKNAYSAGDPSLGISPDSILATKYSVRFESSSAQ